jgi:hypothetical protein
MYSEERGSDFHSLLQRSSIGDVPTLKLGQNSFGRMTGASASGVTLTVLSMSKPRVTLLYPSFSSFLYNDRTLPTWGSMIAIGERLRWTQKISSRAS